MTWSDRLKELRAYWIGKKVSFEGKTYEVKDVDSNGALLIDKKARFTELTAVATYMIEEIV